MNDQYEVLEGMKNDIEEQLDSIEDQAEAAGYSTVGFTAKGPFSDHEEAFLANQWLGLWKEKVQLDMQLYQISFPDAKLEMNDEGTGFRSVS